MQQQFRAGLIVIILTLLLVLTTAAPILPHKTSSVTSPSRNVSIKTPVSQLPSADTLLGNSQNQVITVQRTKNVGPKEADILYRRNIFKKIGHAFKSSLSFSLFV